MKKVLLGVLMILDLNYLIEFGQVQIEITSSSFWVLRTPKNVDGGAEIVIEILFYPLVHNCHFCEKLTLPYYFMHSGIIKVFIVIIITPCTYLVTFFAHGQED